jgi:hypothetical protein
VDRENRDRQNQAAPRNDAGLPELLFAGSSTSSSYLDGMADMSIHIAPHT